MVVTGKRACAPFPTALVFFLGGSAHLSAQGVSVAGHASTLGIGADVSLGLGSRLALRGGANILPWEPSYDFDDVEFTVNFASPSYRAVLDLYPTGGSFRLTGGIVYFTDEHEVRARLNEPVEIGDVTYTPDQVGTLSGVFDTREIAPYLGIGFGRARRGLGFAMDLGAAIQGSPDVRLSATGPIASQPVFQINLAREEENIEEDAKPFRFYPVLSLGLVIGF